MNLAAGTRLGPYEVIDIIGSGGMGEVYKAHDTRLNRLVALKFLRSEDGPGASSSILREARAAARLNHPHIAAIYDVVSDPERPFFVMEFVQGESLASLIARGPVAIDRVIGIGAELSGALAYAHRQGLIHRDVKPSNVLVRPDGAVKLLDLGVARDLGVDPLATTCTPTSAGGLKGTPAYMAPEQLLGRAPTAQSDVYGVGVVLYELLTARRPFISVDVLSLAVAIATGPVPRVSTHRADVPRALDDVVARAMARDPAQRFASAQDLHDVLEGLRTTGRLPAMAQPPRRAMARFAVLGTLVIALAGGGFWLSRLRAPALGPAPTLVLPVLNPAEDSSIESLGVGLASVVADNLATASGLTVVSTASATARALNRDPLALAHTVGAGYVVSLSMRPDSGRVHIDGQLLKAGRAAPVWQDVADGDPLTAERRVMEGIAGALTSNGILPRALTAEERGRLSRLPTDNPSAFARFAEGRTLLEHTPDRQAAEQAAAAFTAATQLDPNFGLAFAALAQADAVVYDHTKDPAWLQRATDHATHALSIDPNRSLVHVSLARVYRAAARYDDAERHARVAVSMSPQSDEAHRELANVLNARGDVDGAVAELRTAVALRPEYGTGYATLGYTFIIHARYAEAIAPLRRATELNPADANSFQLLGTAYHYLGDLQQAIGNYEHALRLHPVANAYANLATLYYSDGRFQDAVSTYQDALKVDPTSPTSHYDLADAYTRLGQAADARREYEEAITRAQARLAVNSKDRESLALIAASDAKLGRFDDADRRLAEALALGPPDVDVTHKSAVVQALAGRPDAAMAALGQALRMGYRASFAADDWDLRSLRNDPRFIALIQQYRSK